MAEEAGTADIPSRWIGMETGIVLQVYENGGEVFAMGGLPNFYLIYNLQPIAGRAGKNHGWQHIVIAGEQVLGMGQVFEMVEVDADES